VGSFDEIAKQANAGCTPIIAVVVVVFIMLGWATFSKTGNLVEVPINPPDVSAAGVSVGPLPDVGLFGPSASSSAPGQQAAAPAAPAPAADDQGSGSGSSDAGQQVAQAPTDAGSSNSSGSGGGGSVTPPPPATCALPGSITVQGGNPSSVGGSGGTVTVASTPFALITPTLVNCGQHYELSFSASGNGGTASGHDCKMEGFDYDISAYVQVGQTVTIQLLLPPNECG
jgi:hypothetical protein